MILALSGASGVGKSTVIQSLIARSDKYRRLTTITTRAPRPDDRPKEIIHVSNSEFDELAHSGQFIWEVSIFGNRYASLRSELEAALINHQTVLLCDVAPQAIDRLNLLMKEAEAENHTLRKIYLAAPSQIELERRLRQRRLPEDQIASRMAGLRNVEAHEILSAKYDLIISSNLTASEVSDIVHSVSGVKKF